jgi:DNA/RNA endonuclease G (NUC1)
VAESSGPNGWWATSWTKADGDGFFGKPVTVTTNKSTTILVRYTRYVTDYDAAFHSPVWGAYTVDSTTVANDLSGKRTASNPDFKRPSKFMQEPLVVALSKRLHVEAAKHETFGDAVDPRYPVTPASLTAQQALAKPSIIQRGHMVPNNALKCTGTYEEGQLAQKETFSVANIVPQMKLSNAPSWSALESACLDWAKEIGQVWLFVGPIYHNKTNPVLTAKRTTGEKLVVPSPDELYYVVIGKRGGKTAAVGFKMPHIPEIIDFHKFAVSVDEIEKATGINFMPALGEPNPAESSYDPAWLKTPARRAVEDDDS